MRPMKFRRIRAYFCAAFALVALVASAQSSAPNVASVAHAAPPPLDKVTLQLKWKHQWQFAGFYAAVEQGFYEDAGLDVTLRELGDGEDPTEIVVSGEAEFGVSMSDLVLVRSKGHPVVALAPIYQHSPLVLAVDGRTGVDNFHALKGHDVALLYHEAELLAYFEYEGFSVNDVVVHPLPWTPQPLIDGKLTAMAAYSTDQIFALEQADIPYLIFNPRSAGIDFYGDTLFTTERQVRDHPERVKNFLDASLKGWKYAMENPGEICQLIYKKYSQRHSIEHLRFEAEQSASLIMPDVVEVGYMNPGRWRHISTVYASLGMLPEGFDFGGFLYDRDPKPDLTWLYASLAGSVALAVLIFLVALRYYQLNRTIRKQSLALEKAVEDLKVLRGIIPICSHCRRIRDPKGLWFHLERYIMDHSDAAFSHGICEECLEEHYGDVLRRRKKQDGKDATPPKDSGRPG